MNELEAILEAAKANSHQPMALATLVKASGSTYRRPGARMLVLPGGASVGSISGGCLEGEVIEQSRQVLQSGQALLRRYDTSPEEDVLFGAGLGCKGEIEVLIEPVGAAKPTAGRLDLLELLQTLFQERQTAVIATLFRTPAAAIAPAGARLVLNRQGAWKTDIVNEELESRMLADARQALESNRSSINEHPLPAGLAEVFVEVIHSPTSLVIFGGGYDAVALVRLARELGFHVTVVDRRPAYATSQRFPQAHCVAVAQPEEDLAGKFPLDSRSAALVMSHNYMVDRAFLKALLPLPLLYLGVMGPRKRAERMLQELSDQGVPACQAALTRLHNPVGLDIGAESPEQIALAILAEIQAVLSGHPGGMLREKRGPIHQRE